MASLWQRLHKIGDILHLPDLPKWLCGFLLLILILRIPSFFEPYYYGDEMIYMTLGQGVRQEATLYTDLHDNKPPLLYWTAALAGSLFWFKVILAFWSIATIILFYQLSKIVLKKNTKAQTLATILFGLLTTLPLLEGNIVNAELFMIGASILAFIWLLEGNLSHKKVLAAGFMFGIAALFKVPAMFEVPVIIVYWMLTDTKNWKTHIKNSILLIVGFLVPILLTFVWYFFRGALPEYIRAAFLQNVGYLSSFRPDDVQKSFIARNAPLLIRATVAAFGVGVLFILRKRVSSKFILLTVWLLFTLFAVTLSERPYPHYFIQAVAPLSILLSMLVLEKSIEQVLVIVPITLAVFVPFYYKFYLYPTASYYSRFIDFATKKIDKETYFSGFDSNTNRNYKLAEFLTTSSKVSDRVFMWDPDSSTVYSLSRRLPPIKWVADYHVKDFSSKAIVAEELALSKPKFIILTSGHPYSELIPLIENNYVLIEQIEDANIYLRINLDPQP